MTIPSIFLVGFLIYDVENLGEYKFNTPLAACRFVSKVQKKYNTSSFGYAIREFGAHGNLVECPSGPQSPNGCTYCSNLLEKASEPARRAKLIRELNGLYEGK